MTTNDRRDLGAVITTEKDHIPLISGDSQLMGGIDPPCHVGSMFPLNKTVCLEESSLGVESNVQVLSPRSDSLLDKLEGMHGTVHVEKCEKEGLVFSAGGSEPVKRNVGKWKRSTA